MSIFGDAPRSASVVVASHVAVLRLDPAVARALVQDQPDWPAGWSRFSARLGEADPALVRGRPRALTALDPGAPPWPAAGPARYPARVTDEHLQALERRWRETGSDADGATWLAARGRAGLLDAGPLAFAAWLGFGPAVELLGEESPDPSQLFHAGLMDKLWGPKGLTVLQIELNQACERWVAPEHAPGWNALVIVAAARACLAPPRGGEAVRILDELDLAVRSGSKPGVEAAIGALARVRLGDVGAAVQATLAGEPDAARVAAGAFLSASGPVRPVWEEVRRSLLRAILPIELPRQAPRQLVRLRVNLVRADDLPAEVVDRAVSWLGALPLERPRSLLITVLPQVVSVPSGARRPEVWSVLEQVRAHLRGQHELLVLVTGRGDELGWFTTAPRGQPRWAVVHLDAFARQCLRTPLPLILVHLLVSRVLTCERRGQSEQLFHETPRGCAFDLCREKAALDARIKAGGLCAECRQDLAQRLPPHALQTCERVLDAIRSAALAAERAG